MDITKTSVNILLLAQQVAGDSAIGLAAIYYHDNHRQHQKSMDAAASVAPDAVGSTSGVFGEHKGNLAWIPSYEAVGSDTFPVHRPGVGHSAQRQPVCAADLAQSLDTFSWPKSGN